MIYLKYNAFLLYYQALYKLEANAGALRTVAFYSWRLICNAIIFWSLFTSAMFIKKNDSGELAPIFIVCMNSAINATCVVRMNYFYLFGYKAEAIVRVMNSTFQFETSTGVEEKSMKSKIALSNKITFLWMVGCILMHETFTIGLSFFKHRSQRLLPLDAWYPFDWEKTPLYETTFLLQAITQCVAASTMCSIDVFLMCSMILTAFQFELLGVEIKNLFYASLIDNGVPKRVVLTFRDQLSYQRSTDLNGLSHDDVDDERLGNIMASRKFNEDVLRRLHRLIGHHQALLSFCSQLEDFFSPLLLAYFVLLMLAVLFEGFIFITANDPSLLSMSFLYMVVCITGIFLPALSGQLLYSQSEKLHADLYDVPWYLCDRNFGSSFRLMQQRIGKPITITLGKFADVNLNVFLWTLKTAMSYFTVMRQVIQKN